MICTYQEELFGPLSSNTNERNYTSTVIDNSEVIHP